MVKSWQTIKREVYATAREKIRPRIGLIFNNLIEKNKWEDRQYFSRKEVRLLLRQANINKRISDAYVEAVTENLREAIASNDEITLWEFGRFRRVRSINGHRWTFRASKPLKDLWKKEQTKRDRSSRSSANLKNASTKSGQSESSQSTKETHG